MLKKVGSRWKVYDSTGKKELGSHPTKKAALNQVAAIEASKARRAKPTKRSPRSGGKK